MFSRAERTNRWPTVILLMVVGVCRALAEADLAIQHTWPPPGISGPGSFVVGRSSYFTLTVTNMGPDSASELSLTNLLPASFALVSASASQGACSNEGGTVVCALGELLNQQSTTVTITIMPTRAGVVTNAATIAPFEGDPNTTNNISARSLFVRAPYVYVSGTNVVEGDAGMTNLPVTLWLENETPQTVSVNFNAASYTATAGADFIGTNGTLIFPPGVITQTVFISVIGDRLYEVNVDSPKVHGEEFFFRLINATNAGIEQRASAICGIVDDDPIPFLGVNDIMVVEGESGTVQATFTVWLSAPSGENTFYRWATSNDTAVAGSDFVGRTALATIPRGQMSQSVSISVNGDTLFEPDETFFLTLLNPQNATIGRTQGVCIIIADELVLRLPAHLNENAGDFAGTGEVAVGAVKSSDLVVSLSNSRPDLVVIPDSVVISQGQTNVRFDIGVFDDTLLNGSRLVTVTAAVALHASSSATIAIHDNETTVLGLLVPDSVEQGSGTYTGIVQAATAPDVDVVIALLCDDTNSIHTPSAITLAAGQTSSSFQLTVPNDFVLAGNKTVALTAHVQNWTDATAAISVLDLTNITLTVPTSLIEGQWATGTVQSTAAATTNLLISLTSSDNTVLTLPPVVQIAPGELAATFAFQATDNADYRGTQTVAVVAACDVLRGTTNNVMVFENDPHHFTISRVPVSRQAYVLYYDLQLTAADHRGEPLPFFNRSASLSATGIAGAVDVTPSATQPFSGGMCTHAYVFHSWDNNVRLRVSDGQGHTGESNPFNIVRPAYHALNLAVHDLAWDAVRGRICASVYDYWNSVSNTLAFINPENGKIEDTLYIGQGPGKLAITEDSRWLYVGLLGTNLVRRLDLATRTVDLEFSLGVDSFGRRPYPEDMQVQPGNPDVLVVSRMNPGVSPRHAGIVAYDHGVPRGTVYQGFFGPNPIEFGQWPTRLYGYDAQVSTFAFHRMNVTGGGIVGESSAYFLRDYNLDFRYGNGRIYINNGQIFNPETGGLIGSFPNGVEPIPAPDIGKVICIRQNGSYSDMLQIYDEATLGLLDQQFIPGADGRAASGIRCGESVVAFRTTGYDVYILYSEYLADLDRDNLPDWWEREHFGNAAATDGTPDSDNDGTSNYEEWVAGTDPRNGADAVRVTGARVNGPDTIVTFDSVVGRCYRLERSSDLSTWTTVDELPGTSDTVVITDAGAASVRARFYRLVVFF